MLDNAIFYTALLFAKSDLPVTLFILYLDLFYCVRSWEKSVNNFEDRNFADSKSFTKTVKISYLENLYIYGT